MNDEQREAGEKKFVLSLSAKPTSSIVTSGDLELNSPKLTANPLKANPLKRPNPLMQASAISSAAEKSNGAEPFSFSCGEAHLEEQERKCRRMEREGKTI